jgi:phosphoribosylaminoimidazolecarboxamide formyltransferase/IMP cyclohydrolase
LLSVWDKTGIVEFAKGLCELGYTILSTGGTAKLLLSQANLDIVEVADYTDFPEMLDGRVKTLNPKIHAGILAIRSNPKHMQALDKHNISTIDIVAVNLYPFTQTIANDNCTLAHAIENIDIGGPTMLRAAAKNYSDVAVIVDYNDYDVILNEIKQKQEICLQTKFRLARKVFNHTAMYDGAISNYLSSICSKDESINQAETSTPKLSQFPRNLNLHYKKIQDLRYGENPHQNAAVYADINSQKDGIAFAKQLQGKELSYNNIADANTAWECAKSFESTACVIIKHANPCGVGIASNTLEAYTKAWQTDSTSAFGGIIAFNSSIDKQTANAIMQQFVEVIIAPHYSKEALEIFATKPNIRLLTSAITNLLQNLDIKSIGGGVLVQTSDIHHISLNNLKIVTKQQPTSEQMQDMLFAWNVAKFVKSNAIVFCKNGQTLGIGAGQMSRIDSAKIASIKAEDAKLKLNNSAVASDAFFPFKDALDVVADAGASCIIQPGGSIRDEIVIQRADERGLVMAFTNVRHFKH